MGYENSERTREAKDDLVGAFSAFGGESLRDIWLFDTDGFESLFVREDIGANIEDVDVAPFIDNERYGYVTRDTYRDLYYADYEYTVRGFDEFEQFRTFLTDDDRKVGVFASLDQQEGGYDFDALYDALMDIATAHSGGAFAPEQRGSRSRPKEN